MSAYRHGDASAFEVLYARHRAPLYRYVRRQSGADVVDEIFQEVWMAVIRVRAGYEPTAKFSTWLYRIAHNKLVDYYRAAGRRGTHETPMPEDEAGTVMEFPDAPELQPEHQLDRHQLAQRISSAVDALPAAQREAFVLAAETGMSVEEIAETTGTGFETAKSRLRYAHARLRALLGDAR